MKYLLRPGTRILPKVRDYTAEIDIPVRVTVPIRAKTAEQAEALALARIRELALLISEQLELVDTEAPPSERIEFEVRRQDASLFTVDGPWDMHNE